MIIISTSVQNRKKNYYFQYSSINPNKRINTQVIPIIFIDLQFSIQNKKKNRKANKTKSSQSKILIMGLAEHYNHHHHHCSFCCATPT